MSQIRPGILLIALMLNASAFGQSLLFSHLNAGDGLSDNNVRSVTIDKNGFLWMGTNQGLNRYDGYSVSVFEKDHYPLLASNTILHLFTDSRNCVWVGTGTGASWLDEKREFHRVTILDTLTSFYCSTIFETKRYGIVLFTNHGHFYYDSTTWKWTKIGQIPAAIKQEAFLDAEPFSDNQVIFTMDSLVALYDYATEKILYQQSFSRPVTACLLEGNEIAIGLQTGQVLIADIKENRIVRRYQLTHELDGKLINTYLSEVRRASNGDLVVATDYAGLVTIDRDGNINRYTHDPLKSGTLSANNTYRAYAGNRGEVIVGTYTSGVNMTNVYNKPAGYGRVFQDQQGNLFDNYLNQMVEAGDDVFWIGSYDRLIRWDKKTNLSRFYYRHEDYEGGMRRFEIKAVELDRSKRVWVSAWGDGLFIVHPATGQFQRVKQNGSSGSSATSKYIFDLLDAGDRMWVGSTTGLYTIDTRTFAIKTLDDDSLLKDLSDKRIYNIYQDAQRRLWIGTGNAGVYCYDQKAGTIKQFSLKNGLLSNTVFSVAVDAKGDAYIATSAGFNVLTSEGKLKAFTQQHGLRYDRCESILADEKGFVWITNTKTLVRFNPADSSMQYFEENAGMSIDGFRAGSYLKTSKGELMFGSQSGINYFYPDQLISASSPLRLSIYGMNLGDSVLRLTNDRNLTLSYSHNDITFRFTAISLSGSIGVSYRYRLEGSDEEWYYSRHTREARYSALPPGRYRFVVQASLDGVNWVGSNNAVEIQIRQPLWQRWWFIALVVSLVAGVIYWLISSRNRKIEEQKEEIETEQAISYFASSIYETHSVKAILWDVTKNCIGRLHFEDCVIYLLDHERQVLIQRAAHGPKSPASNEINIPIEIPVGKGITGTVALTGKAEIIPDTSKDPRYIVDDVRRFSEICVPIIANGRMLGVIDCEHSKKGFFTQKHLSILTTIASLCANKIVKAKAEAEKAKAEATLMDTQRKMAEVEMQALRAQMNPHFIFNCLNSINRYIVKSDQATASLYLTRFAKLIRLILDNSNSKSVSLANELEALRLYIEMESIRFEKKFFYSISVDPNVQPDYVYVPPLIIQPYVENAIWHGLLHKETTGHLAIHVSRHNSSVLQCVIEDNGVGREKARELKSKSASTRKSLGMKLTEDRLALLNKTSEASASVAVEDLLGEEGEAVGTKVILTIPVDA